MKEKLLGLKAKKEKITIDGIDVIVTELTAGQFQAYQNSLYTMQGNTVKYKTEEAMSKLIAMTVLEEDGSLMFGIKDIELVKGLPSHVADAIFQKASDLNGLNSTEKN